MAAQPELIERQEVPATVEQTLPTANGADALMRLIERATLDPAFDVTKLEKLLEMKERWEATEARKAFVAAKAAFKSEALVLGKNKRVEFESERTKQKTSYNHATLDHVAEVLSPALSKNNLSYSWETAQADGGMITVTCILTHVMGHSERVSLRAGADTSGSKNNIQAVGSTVTYLQRYTLLAVTGMATADQDNDGMGNIELISPEQKDELVALIEETKADSLVLLKFFGVGSLDALPVSEFDKAVMMLEAKKKKQVAS